MKFRLPFQIYRTGVISRSNSPSKIINTFCKDNEAKVCKKTSKINISYRAIISNYIYRFTHLPLKRTMSKLRSRAILRSSTKSHNSKLRNEFVFLREASRENPKRQKRGSDKVISETSECCMNSIKCANFMCAKSTARILLKQKDLLCNKNSNKSVAANSEDVKQSKENIAPKDEAEKNSTSQVPKDSKVNTNAANCPTPRKIERSVEQPVKEKHKQPDEYKWKFNKSENAQLKRLKCLNSDNNRNYRTEESPPTPVRMDKVMGISHSQYPKKLPELPVQIMPKIEQVRPKDAPTLMAPKRKHNVPEVTRNYKKVEDVTHGPLRMDNLVGKKHFNPGTAKQSTSSSKNNQGADGKKENKKHNFPTAEPTKVATKAAINDEKDAFLVKLDQVVVDLMPNTKIQARNLQQFSSANINVSEKIRKYEELIQNSFDKHKTKVNEKKLAGLKDKKALSSSTPKLSPFAIAEIRRKYYPPDTFEKQPLKISPQMTFEVPLVEKSERSDRTDRTETKMRHLYAQPKEQKTSEKKLDSIEISPTGNIKKKHAKARKMLACNSGAEKGRDCFTFDIDNDTIVESSTNSTIEPPNINVTTAPNVLIPPPTKLMANENKRNFSSSASNEYKEALNDDILNDTNTISSNSTAPTNTPKQKPPSIAKKGGEIITEGSRGKKQSGMEANAQDIEILMQERKFSTDVLTRNPDDNSPREIERNTQRTSQRNISKRHCTIKITPRTSNQDSLASSASVPEKLTRKLSYQYHREQYAITKNMNIYNLAPTPIKETIAINSDVLLTEEDYNKMLNEKTTLINEYIKWRIQFHNIGIARKSSMSLANKINKQHKYKLRRYKIVRRKQKVPSTSNITLIKEQPEPNKEVTSKVDLIKNQVAQNCMLFDKISDALLKKTEIINYCNQASNEIQQKNDEKIESLQDNKKRKLSPVPLLEKPPKKKHVPLAEKKHLSSETSIGSNRVLNLPIPKPKTSPAYKETVKHIPRETKSASPSRAEVDNRVPILEIKNIGEPMDLDPQEIDSPQSSVDDEIKKTISRRFSFKLKGPRVPSRETICVESKPSTPKMKPLSIPATLKAKKFLAKIEAGPDEARQLLIKKIDKKIKSPKSKTKVIRNTDKIGKYIA